MVRYRWRIWMKRIIGCFFVMMILFMPQASALIDNPKTLGDLRANYNELLQEQAENEALSEAAKQEIAEKEAAVKQAEEDIHQAEADMEQAEEDIRVSNEKIEELTKEADQVLLYLQQVQGGNAYVEYVTGSSTMTEMVMRIAAIEQVSDSIQSTMEDLEQEIKKNEELKVELEEKTEQLEKQSEEYKKIIEENYGKLEEYDKYALDIDTQVESAKEQLDSYVSLCSSVLGDTGDDVVLTSCSKVPVSSGWMKPLNYGIITSTIGYRWGSYHNALDIGGASPFEGTPVYAAAAGVVSGMVYEYSCGGNMLYIDVNVDGKEYTTYYYHFLRFNVSMGQTVDTNTIIGWVGGYSTSSVHGGYDTCTTGAHLHFGVATGYYNGYSIPMSNVITPPGFPNQSGWSFYSRTQMY